MLIETELVIDIGQTHIKYFFINSENFTLLKKIIEKNNFIEKKKYFYFNHSKFKNDIYKKIFKYKKYFVFNNIVSTSFGSTSFFLNKKGAILDNITYNNNSDASLENEYLNLLPSFKTTLTPLMNNFHNMGKQILLMKKLYKKSNEKLDSLINLPNLSTYFLSHEKGFDKSYFACHSHLFDYTKRDVSSLINDLSLVKFFKRFDQPFDIAGNPSRNVISKLKLKKNCNIRFGCHDTNSTYFFHKNMNNENIDLICTGTWFIIMSEQFSKTKLTNNYNSFANFSLNNKIVPSFRFPAGLIFEKFFNKPNKVFSSKHSTLDISIINKVLIKYYSNIKNLNYNFTNTNYELKDLEVIINLNIALETDFYLSKINSRSNIIIDGNFAFNEYFIFFLKILRNKQKVFLYKSINSTACGFLYYLNKSTLSKHYNLKEINIVEKIESIDKIKEKYKNFKINNHLIY